MSSSPSQKNQGFKKPKKITPAYLNNAGMFYLKRYSASVSHFKKIMKRKIDRSCQYHDDLVKEDCIAMLDELVAKFIRLGLLDDKSYARTKIISYRRKGYGKKAIKARLQRKGLNSSLINEVLGVVDDDKGLSDYIAALRYMHRRRLGCFRKLTTPTPDHEMQQKQRQKELASLARAGFSFDTAKKALNTSYEEAKELSDRAYQ